MTLSTVTPATITAADIQAQLDAATWGDWFTAEDTEDGVLVSGRVVVWETDDDICWEENGWYVDRLLVLPEGRPNRLQTEAAIEAAEIK
ncbi:hypothetical protein [Adonisia turfae]|uniref:Uncharacterized protein n=1 Tax=Adonisia turfae CCMR0081 TaxID=2292702 RepID=A0A6M0RGV6_9CYAN|nr:hypothetical protein [Adonisia turfae]NEZ55478.1 hypothetical protein [Adonisia turfae CCMR0081]